MHTGCFEALIPSQLCLCSLTLMKLCLSHCCCLLLWSDDAALLRSISKAALQPQTRSQSPQTPHRHQREHPSPATLPGLQKHHLLCVERMRNTPAASRAVSCAHRCVELEQLRGCSEISLSSPTSPILQIQSKSVSIPKAGTEE